VARTRAVAVAARPTASPPTATSPSRSTHALAESRGGSRTAARTPSTSSTSTTWWRWPSTRPPHPRKRV